MSLRDLLGPFLLLAVLCGPAIAGPAVRTEADIEAIEDPIALDASAQHWLKAGNEALAKACFRAALERRELNLYWKIKAPYSTLLIQERMGDLAGARRGWKAQFEHDVYTSYFFINRLSVDPERGKLLAVARALVKTKVAAAKAGESPHIYTTKKGKSRTLTVVPDAEALARLEAGEKLKYAYIESLDLSGKTFEKPIRCSRCIIGELKAYGSTFKDKISFSRTIFLGDAHFGKKWKGKVNKSAIIPASRFARLYLDKSIIFGSLNLDSVKVEGRVANLPLITVDKTLDLRNAHITGTLEMRFSSAGGEVRLKGAELDGPVYMGHGHFGSFSMPLGVVRNHILFLNSAVFEGPVTIERSDIPKGATFENSVFKGPVVFRQSRIGDRLNFSRSAFESTLMFTQIKLQDLDFFGAQIHQDANFDDCVFKGNINFALDGLTRRRHAGNPDPLHKLYKQYQGDEDAEADLTTKSQYGVRSVNDLTAQIDGSISFANTIFEKFVNFEGVSFGAKGADQTASFYNTQFKGEAHFERTRFNAVADFRTIFGNEIAFNQARFAKALMLDDANVPGRMTMADMELNDGAQISFYNARIAAFGVGFAQLREPSGAHRLYYERCAAAEQMGEYVKDSRLADASWDLETEQPITDAALVARRAKSMCMARVVNEFVILRASFNKRSMRQESDWAYWHLRHFKNIRQRFEAKTFGESVGGWVQYFLFEWGFGWGVKLFNLFGISLLVILGFIGIARTMCGDVVINWDEKPVLYKDLSIYAMFLISFHSFLGRARDWKSGNSNTTWKVIYTTEMIIGIIVITFFIGAYTSAVLK